MIAIEDFIKKYNNQYVEEVDASNPNQCFDLVLRYCKENGIPTNIFPFMGASDIYDKFGPDQAKYFDRFFNGPNDIPPVGAIAVFTGYFNGYWYNGKYYLGRGHTGLVRSADLYSVQLFEQNDPTTSSSHVKTYSYQFISGWLIPKLSIDWNSKFNQLKISIDRLKSETDNLNAQIDKKSAYEGTMTKVNKIATTGSL